MLLLPWLGVGTTPAIVALALLAIPPIVISVDLGIRGVSRRGARRGGRAWA